MQFFPLRFVHLHKPKKKLVVRPKLTCGKVQTKVLCQLMARSCQTSCSVLSVRHFCVHALPLLHPLRPALATLLAHLSRRQKVGSFMWHTRWGDEERDRQTEGQTERPPTLVSRTLDGSFECLYLCTLLSQSPAACLLLATRHLPHATCHLPLALFAWLRIILTTFGRKRHTNFIGKLLVRASATAITSQTNVVGCIRRDDTL